MDQSRGVPPVAAPHAERLVVPVLTATGAICTGQVADALAAALDSATRVTNTAAGPHPAAGVVVVDGLPAGGLMLAGTGWPHAVPVLLVELTPPGVRAAAGLLATAGPGVARRTVLGAVQMSSARPAPLAYALLHVTAGLAAAAVPLPRRPHSRGRRSRPVAVLAAAVRAVPAAAWPDQPDVPDLPGRHPAWPSQSRPHPARLLEAS